jgi:hypothetical protein
MQQLLFHVVTALPATAAPLLLTWGPLQHGNRKSCLKRFKDVY